MAFLRKEIRFVFYAALVLLAITTIATYMSFKRFSSSSLWVEHTYQVIIHLEKTISSLKDAEIAQKGFLLTDRKEFKEQFQNELIFLNSCQKSIGAAVGDNMEQSQNFDTLNTLINRRVSYLLRGARLWEKDSLKHFPHWLLDSKTAMDSVRNQVNKMENIERELLHQRISKARKYKNLSLSVIALFVVFALAIILYTFRRLNQQFEKAEETQKELEKYLRELNRKNNELNQFASAASHDLKEPLRKIQLFSGMLGSDYGSNLDGEAKEFLERIQSSAQRMQVLIEDLLRYSKMGVTAEAFTEVELNKLIDELLLDLEIAIKEKNAQVKIDDLPVIEAVPTQIRQLFQNLIINALKYSRSGVPPLISITSKKTGSDIIIEVEDNGIGFDQKYAEKIFDLFQRLHTRDAFEGTGIGLALCKKIMEIHHGSITALSKEGTGSLFILKFPLNTRLI